jgi:cobalamin biosynthesis protein CobT
MASSFHHWFYLSRYFQDTRSCPVRRIKEDEQLQEPAADQHREKQTGIPSPDSLSQAMPPWLTGFYL